ncbi:transposase [Nonomuraea sp. PA05]|nr:transposase [Nonomuraea sp. PA05]
MVGGVVRVEGGAGKARSIADQVRAELVVDALRAAAHTRVARSAPVPTNAAAESFNASLKRETPQGAHRWPDARTARLAVFRWITRYNTVRRHSHLGQLSPIDYEKTAPAGRTASAGGLHPEPERSDPAGAGGVANAVTAGAVRRCRRAQFHRDAQGRNG